MYAGGFPRKISPSLKEDTREETPHPVLPLIHLYKDVMPIAVTVTW